MEIIQIAADDSLYIFAPRIFTGIGSLVQQNTLLAIRNGIIESVRPITEDGLAALFLKGSKVHRIDPDCTLMAALIDAHIHLDFCCRNGSFPEAKVPLTNKEEDRGQVMALFKQLLQAGIGLVRDGGDRQAFNLRARELAATNPAGGIKVVSTGEALRKHGGYGSFLGRGYRSRTDLEQRIAQTICSGVDQLKVVISGVISFSEYGEVKGPLMPTADLALIVETARRYKLRIMAHASSAAAVDLAVNAGVDSVEHGYFFRKETIEKMADQQIAWVPTIIPVAAQLSGPQLRNYTPAERAVIRKAYREQQEKLSFAFECGVPVGVGTDAGAVGVQQGSSLISEMELYRESNIPTSTIINAATAVNAKILGLGREAGTIEAGKKPHLLAVCGNPLADLSALRHITRHFVPVYNP